MTPATQDANRQHIYAAFSLSRRAYRLAKMIGDHEGPHVVQAWFRLNPELKDGVPARLLRDEDVEGVGPELLGAARAFLAGG